MTRIIATVLLLLLFPASAWGANQARMTMTVTIDPAELGLPANKSAEAPPPLSMLGRMYWNEQSFRFDMIGNPGVPPVSVIYDYAAQAIYEVDHSRNLALRRSMTELSSTLGPLAANLDSPEQLLFSWQQVEQLRTLDGVKYSALGNKTIDGYPCRGFAMTFDLQRLAADQRFSDELGLGILAKLIGEFTTTTWVSEALGLPLLTSIAMQGVAVDMRLDEIKDFAGTAAFFQVPVNYRIEEAPQLDLKLPAEVGST